MAVGAVLRGFPRGLASWGGSLRSSGGVRACAWLSLSGDCEKPCGAWEVGFERLTGL